MKLFGDIPQEHKDLEAKLLLAERDLDLNIELDRTKLAKGYVCLAHDWYIVGADEEGIRLLAKAEQISPGYFKTMIAKHCYESADFEYLVRNMTAQLIYMILSKLEEKRQ